MNKKNEFTVGILGGMGPEATCLFFQKIIQNTPASKDQDHLKIIIYNDPAIPDRTKAILDKNNTPAIKAKTGLGFLSKAAVDVITIPCVSMHFYYDKLIQYVDIPILNIIRETVSHIKKTYPENKHIGLLATTGTVQCRIFEKELIKAGLQVIIPEKKNQELLMECIYGPHGVKSGNLNDDSKTQAVNVAESLIDKGAEVIIGGCTEIPFILKQGDLRIPFIDSLDILSGSVIEMAGMRPKGFK